MIKTKNEIHQIYMDVYPDMEKHYAMTFSEEFKVWSTFGEAFRWVKKHSVAGIPHIQNVRDCEKRAWKVWADIQWDIGMLSTKGDLTKTIGWLTGFQMPFGTPHTIITTFSEDRGIVNIDPLKNTIEDADVTKFNALLLVM